MNLKFPRPGRRLLAVALSGALLLVALWYSDTDAKSILRGFLTIPSWAVVAVLIAHSGNLIFVSFRLWRMLDHFGMVVPWRVASRASISGYIAGLFVTSLLGQALGRQAELRSSGVRPVVVASLTAYERAIVMIVSGTLALAGTFLLLGNTVISVFFSRIPVAEITIAATLGCLLSLCLGRSHFEAKIATKLRSRTAYQCLVEITVLTIVGQLVMMSALVIGILSITSHIPFWSIFAAAAIVNFASSIPVTLNGWGIREVTAVYAFGKLGVPSADAISVSVMVGLCSTLAVFVAALFSIKK